MSASRNETIVVEQSLPSERLDRFLCERFPVVSRGTIQRLIDEGHIRVNGQKVKSTHHPHAGETIDVHWPEARPAKAQPEDIPLEVLYEDEHLLVLNKAVGLVVHPAGGHEEHTLVNALLHHCQGQLSGIGGVARPGIVHRLDRDTSGCLVVAKHDAAHLALAAQFAERQTEKSYQALVCGEVPDEAGDIRAPIARHPSHRKRMAVRTGDNRGRDSWTSYRVLERLSHVTLLEALLHTGRTHQIRVHFQHLGYPIVGDTTYGKRHNALLTERTNFTAGRQMLHAWKLAFTHPETKKKMNFMAPLPPDFRAALKALRKD